MLFFRFDENKKFKLAISFLSCFFLGEILFQISYFMFHYFLKMFATVLAVYIIIWLFLGLKYMQKQYKKSL